MAVSARWIVPLLLLSSACSDGMEGFWIGRIECGGLPFDWEWTLEKETAKSYLGAGEQTREFTSVEGRSVSVIIDFDVTLDLDKASGAQTLDAEIVCTAEQTVETPPGGGDPEVVAEGCTALRFRDYQVDWDGADTIGILGADGCEGDIVRR
jgi:hypothetical protein